MGKLPVTLKVKCLHPSETQRQTERSQKKWRKMLDGNAETRNKERREILTDGESTGSRARYLATYGGKQRRRRGGDEEERKEERTACRPSL